MDIFANIDTESILASLNDIKDEVEVKPETRKETATKDLKLNARWSKNKGLTVSIPESKMSEINWKPNSKIDIIVHENFLILYPHKGFLNLKKPSKGYLGREVVIPESYFENIESFDDNDLINIQFDDMTCYHRMIVEFSKKIPVKFQC